MSSPSAGLQKSTLANSELVAVSAAAHDDVWAVGNWTNSIWNPEDYSFQRPFALHWDGATWNVELDSIPFGNNRTSLTAVTALKGEVWALGITNGYWSDDSHYLGGNTVSLHRKATDCLSSSLSGTTSHTAGAFSPQTIGPAEMLDKDAPTETPTANVYVPTPVPTAVRP